MLAHRIRNDFYFVTGLAALTLVSAKHRLLGYSTATPFSVSDWERSIRHTISIVNDYHDHAAIDGRRFAFDDARVLELGVGPTLGTGLLLAGFGIASYLAIDAFPLARSTPATFYHRLVDSPLPAGLDGSRVAAATRALISGDTGLIDYAHNRDFDVQKLVGERRFDLIVSNAAFEHFDNPGEVVAALSRCAAPGALLVALIDFQTHTRFLRQHDPNNIYRYSSAVYRALHFPGQPNRWRPGDYVQALADHGWTNIAMRSLAVASAQYCAWTRDGLAAPFRSESSDMNILTGAIVAQRP